MYCETRDNNLDAYNMVNQFRGIHHFLRTGGFAPSFLKKIGIMEEGWLQVNEKFSHLEETTVIFRQSKLYFATYKKSKFPVLCKLQENVLLQ